MLVMECSVPVLPPFAHERGMTGIHEGQSRDIIIGALKRLNSIRSFRWRTSCTDGLPTSKTRDVHQGNSSSYWFLVCAQCALEFSRDS